jgi:cell division protein FtsL
VIRLLNICVIVGLVVAAAYVYRIKFESTRKAEEVVRLRLEIRREHDAIAELRAEWSKLDNPIRIQDLAQRHLTTLRMIDSHQFDQLNSLPDRPPDLVPPDSIDPIGSLIDLKDLPTASVPTPSASAPSASAPRSPK